VHQGGVAREEPIHAHIQQPRDILTRARIGDIHPHVHRVGVLDELLRHQVNGRLEHSKAHVVGVVDVLIIALAAPRDPAQPKPRKHLADAVQAVPSVMGDPGSGLAASLGDRVAYSPFTPVRLVLMGAQVDVDPYRRGNDGQRLGQLGDSLPRELGAEP